MIGTLLEDEEVPNTLRFGTTRIEATRTDKGPLVAWYEDISEWEVVKVSSGDEDSRPRAEDAILISYCVYAMPNSRFHFAISADSCVHNRHFVNSATHES